MVQVRQGRRRCLASRSVRGGGDPSSSSLGSRRQTVSETVQLRSAARLGVTSTGSTKPNSSVAPRCQRGYWDTPSQGFGRYRNVDLALFQFISYCSVSSSHRWSDVISGGASRWGERPTQPKWAASRFRHAAQRTPDHGTQARSGHVGVSHPSCFTITAIAAGRPARR
jgi:hypothetical protein